VIPPSLDTMLSRIGEIQTPLPPPAALLIGIVAFLVVLGQTLWLVARHVNTIVHEAAHAMVGLGTGRRVRSVRLNPDRSGDTDLVPPSGAGFIAAAIAGYIGPSASGLVAAKLISLGHIVAVLWLGLLLLAAMLLMVRNLFGGILILVAGGLLYLIVRYTPVGVEIVVAYGVAWFLLVSGVKVVVEAGSNPKDARVLAEQTFIWASAWSFLWLLGTIAALVVGAAILV
jgi:Peptidase M50B-like